MQIHLNKSQELPDVLSSRLLRAARVQLRCTQSCEDKLWQERHSSWRDGRALRSLKRLQRFYVPFLPHMSIIRAQSERQIYRHIETYTWTITWTSVLFGHNNTRKLKKIALHHLTYDYWGFATKKTSSPWKFCISRLFGEVQIVDSTRQLKNVQIDLKILATTLKICISHGL